MLSTPSVRSRPIKRQPAPGLARSQQTFAPPETATSPADALQQQRLTRVEHPRHRGIARRRNQHIPGSLARRSFVQRFRFQHFRGRVVDRQHREIELLHLTQACAYSRQQLLEVQIRYQRRGHFQQKRFLGFFALGDVLHYPSEADQLPVLIVQSRGNHVSPESRSILPNPPTFMLRPALRRCHLQVLLGRIPVADPRRRKNARNALRRSLRFRSPKSAGRLHSSSGPSLPDRS